MDRPNNVASSRLQNTDNTTGLEPEGRASAESHNAKLQKKKSTAGVRNASQPLPLVNERYGQSTHAGNQKQRKGSLRSAVRKIFGRRSKELEQPARSSPPRHGYHKSEPHALSPTQEESETSQRQDIIPHRTLSAPLQVHSAAASLRTRSPYAVEFPQSARLKPLNLGSPLPIPASQLRRRKTMPSMLLDDDESAALSRSIGSKDAPPMPGFEIHRDAPTPETVLATYTISNPKRKSRSADNLKGVLNSYRPNSGRKRSEEIRYWRGSIQPSVLRASGFVSNVPRAEDRRELPEDKTPTGGAANPFEAAGNLAGSTAHRDGHSLNAPDPSIGAGSGIGSELSRDLEDRVAKLEAGLQSFQESLHRLTTERNRQTVLVGSVPHGRRNSTDARTPSMLADTLLDYKSYFGSTEHQSDGADPRHGRPSTSPAPQTPVRESVRQHTPATSRYETANTRPSLVQKPSLLPDGVTPGQNKNGNNGKMQDYTFRSLYEMLADERSARRRLEMQLKGLRAEINELHYQVSVGSHVQSQRSSFVPLDPMVGSSRLQKLLVDTDNTSSYRNSGDTGFSSTTLPGGITSRFSGSESEAGAAGPAESQESLTTPYEAYQTPREEHSMRSFGMGDHDSGEGGMF